MRPVDLNSVLIIKFSSVGDVAHATAVARHVKQTTGAHLTWAVDEGILPLLEGHPDVDRLIAFPRDPFGPTGKMLRGVLPGLVRFARELRRERFDAAIDLQGRGRSYLSLLCSRADVKVGRGYFPLLQRRVLHDRARRRHAIDAYFELTDALGLARPVDASPHLPASPTACARVREVLAAGGIDDDMVCLVPGTSWREKCWPPSHWAQTAQFLVTAGYSVVLAGSGPEAGLGREVLNRLGEETRARILPLFGNLNLGEIVALCHLARVVVAGDTGPLHIAWATGTPVVALFGPTDEVRVGPRPLGQSRILRVPGCSMCQPYYRSATDLRPRCRLRCLESLEPPAVIGAIEEVLGLTPVSGVASHG